MIDTQKNDGFETLSKKLSLDQFIKGKRLGKGHFGEVFVVKHKITGFMCALKVISKEHIAAEKVTEQIIR
jgi:aurora kinase